MEKSRLYTPPPGFYDLPYTYAFDASKLVNGSSYPNQQVYIQGGYGDFCVRRVVGLNRILASDGTGSFQLMRASQGVYQSSNPVQSPNSPELAIVPEEWYPETGQIGFDLFGINLPANAGTGQLAFQGSRRLPGSSPLIGYKEDPKTYTYIAQATLTALQSAGIRIVTYTPIDNYDFLLYNVIIMKSAAGTLASFTYDGEAQATTTFTAVTSGVAGNSITITVVSNNGVPNGVFSIAVVGNAITITGASSSLGIPTTTGNDVVAAMAANPAASALVTTTVAPGSGGMLFSSANFGPTNLSGGSGSGGGLTPITTPVCSLQIFDQFQTGISNVPIMDIFYNGGPGSPYENGAVVPPLMFRRNTLVEIDFYSEIIDSGALPTDVVVYLVGRKLYPCG